MAAIPDALWSQTFQGAPREGILQVRDGKSGSAALYICEDYGCLRAGKRISHRQQHRRGSANIPGDRRGQIPPLRPPPGPSGAAPRGPTHVPKEYASDNAQDWILIPFMLKVEQKLLQKDEDT